VSVADCSGHSEPEGLGQPTASPKITPSPRTTPTPVAARRQARASSLLSVLELGLTSDQEQLVDTVRDFCAREFAPQIAANDRAGHHDPEIFAKLASLGLPGVCFPQRYGGYGLDYLSLGLVCEELEYVDTVYRTVLSVHVGLVGMGLYTWATEDQKQHGSSRWASGKKAGLLRADGTQRRI